MFFHFLYPLSYKISFFNIFRYITVRSFLAFLVASAVTILIGKVFINFMKKKQFGQIIRDDGPKEHIKKAGTPTFGGGLIFIGFFTALVFMGNFTSLPVLATLFILLSYALLGFYDDYLKILKKNTKGISPKGKLLWQFLSAGLVVYLLVDNGVIDTKLYLPFFKRYTPDLGAFYIFFGAFVIVGSSNAVNLTDGLDGLAIGPIITSCATIALLSYLAGHSELSNYLYIPYVDGVGELAVLCSALIGAGVGFLWFNSYPAQIFMGDVGSLPLGGVLGTMAVCTQNELLFVLFGGVFVVEALSVILQVGSFKMRKKRIFRMAPIHHHFELKGWAEPKVIVRFWIISIVLAVLSIATIKLR